MEKLKSMLKYILSYFKQEWDLDDYPLRLQVQEHAPENSRYVYQIINWWTVIGLGANKKDAYANLRISFQNHIDVKGHKPRPGVKQPLEFASTDIVENHSDILEDFLENILGFDKNDPVFISDESSLWDFAFGDDKFDYYIKKIEDTYGVSLKGKNIDKISEIIILIKKMERLH